MSHTYDVTNFKLKREFQKRQKWKSQEFMVVLKFWRSENLFNNIADSVTFSIFPESHRKVRKLTVWFNQQKMEISTFWYEKKLVFSLWILLIELRILLFFPFFVFESHDLGIESGENLPIDFVFGVVNYGLLYGL